MTSSIIPKTHPCDRDTRAFSIVPCHPALYTVRSVQESILKTPRHNFTAGLAFASLATLLCVSSAAHAVDEPGTLTITSVEVRGTGDNKTFHLSAAWPDTLEPFGNMIAIIATPSLSPPCWDFADVMDFIPLAKTASKDMPMEESAGFYYLATMEDTTGSGKPDVVEKIMISNPIYHDPDGDGLPTWFEGYIGTDPDNPYSLHDSDPGNPEYSDGNGNPLTDGEIWGEICDCECGGDPEDNTPPDWDGIMGLNLSLADVYLDDDGWNLFISVPFKDSPDTNAAWNPPGVVLTNVDNVHTTAYATVYIEAGQNVEFHIERVEIGQVHWFDEFEVTIDAFIPGTGDPEEPGTRGAPKSRGFSGLAPNWIANANNPALIAEVAYGPNDEPPDVSGFIWKYTAYCIAKVMVDNDDGGLCVGVGTNITMRCKITPDLETAYAPLPTDCVMWQFREFNTSEDWDGWFNLGSGLMPLEYTHVQEWGGVFGIRALLFGDPLLAIIYRRQENEPYPFGSKVAPEDSAPNAWWRVDMPNAIGVCDTQFQVDLRIAARSYLGSEKYKLIYYLPPSYGCHEIRTLAPKCNIFVTHMCRSISTNSVPVWDRSLNPKKIKLLPPVAKEWKNITNEHLTAWSQSFNLQPGCVVSNGKHMGITDYDGRIINAGVNNVNKGFHFDMTFMFRMYKP